MRWSDDVVGNSGRLEQLERWRKRPLTHKLKDNFFYMLNELL